ncbi:MAG TPA: PepSY domain-containing protein [Granulicella sp.]
MASFSVRLLKISRVIHLYMGVYITPMLLFFAFTGFVQTFSLHERLQGREYTPPKILATLGQLHKKQTTVMPQRKGPPPGAAAENHGDDHGGGHGEGHEGKPGGPPQGPQQPAKPLWTPGMWAMKIFFGLVSVGLATSTITGLYMSYKYVRNKVLVTAALVAGVATPLILLLF